MADRRRSKRTTNKVDRDSRSLDRQTIHEWLVAAERGDLPGLKRLLAQEPRLLDALGQGPYWEGNFRALHYAVSRGHRSVVRWLLARGAFASPVVGEADWSPVHFAVLQPKRDLVRLLINRGAEMDIFAAAALGRADVVRRQLRDDPRLVASRGPDGATPLHFAGSPSVAKMLLAAGADPAERDRFHDQTAMEWVIEKPEVAAVLATAGASVDIHLACAMGDVKRVGAFVRHDPDAVHARVVGAKKTIAGEGETPLTVAARYGRRKIVDFLLAHGAQATSVPSPLPGAVHKGDRVLVQRLLRAGADPNILGPYGHAALHAAAVYGNLAMIRLLLSHGARLDLKDAEHDGMPLNWAVYHRHERAAALLRKHVGRSRRPRRTSERR
jgi:ankyrin repeat protein